MGARLFGSQEPAAESNDPDRPMTPGVGDRVGPKGLPVSHALSVSPSDGAVVSQSQTSHLTPQAAISGGQPSTSIPIGQPGLPTVPQAIAPAVVIPPVMPETTPKQFLPSAPTSDSVQLAVEPVIVRDQASQLQVETTEATAQLQERLKLSARMLKATQGQLEASEQSKHALEAMTRSAEHLTDGLREAVQEADHLADETISQFESRIEQVATEQIRCFEEALATRLTEAARVEQRIGDVMTQAQRLTAMVESAEINIAVLAHRAAEAARTADQQAASAAATASHCVETRGILAQDLIDAEQQIEQLAARAEDIRIKAARPTASCEHAINELDTRIRDAVAVAQALQSAARVVTDVSRPQPELPPDDVPGARPDVLESSAPQRLASGDLKTNPPVLEAMLMQMRDAITTDMSRITTAISDIAARVDRLDPTELPTPQVETAQQASPRERSHAG